MYYKKIKDISYETEDEKIELYPSVDSIFLKVNGQTIYESLNEHWEYHIEDVETFYLPEGKLINDLNHNSICFERGNYIIYFPYNDFLNKQVKIKDISVHGYSKYHFSKYTIKDNMIINNEVYYDFERNEYGLIIGNKKYKIESPTPTKEDIEKIHSEYSKKVEDLRTQIITYTKQKLNKSKILYTTGAYSKKTDQEFADSLNSFIQKIELIVNEETVTRKLHHLNLLSDMYNNITWFINNQGTILQKSQVIDNYLEKCRNYHKKEKEAKEKQLLKELTQKYGSLS